MISTTFSINLKSKSLVLLDVIIDSLNLTRDGDPAGKLELNIFYTETKNFLGEIEFYEMGSFETEVDMNSRRVSNMLGSRGEKERIIFYKGPCKTKNIFSCMDQSVNSEEFEVLEDHYREKKTTS